MSLKDQISQETKEAMKAGDQIKTGVLRMLSAAIKNKEIEKAGTPLTDEDVLAAIAKEAKKRQESIDLFEKGGRADLAAKEKFEAEILAKYLPKQLTATEMEKEIGEVLKNNPNLKEFGLAMREVMKVIKGKGDAKLAGEILKKKLG